MVGGVSPKEAGEPRLAVFGSIKEAVLLHFSIQA